MATAHRQRVFIECRDVEHVQLVLYLASCCHLDRWQLNCSQSPLNPLSADVELLNFRGERDLEYLRRLPGVVRVGTYESDVSFPDPEAVRRWVLFTPMAFRQAA